MERHALLRKAALDKLASPERLDVLVEVTSPMGWLALWTIGGVLAGAILWSVFGSITERVDGHGILLHGALREVRASGDGTIESLTVSLRDRVEPGQVIATLAAQSPRHDIGQARARFDAALRAARLMANGPAPARREAELELDAAQADLGRASQSAAFATEVKSTISGRVIEIKKEVGDRVVPTDAILMIEPLAGPVHVVAYVNAQVGKRIRPEMPVEISPTDLDRGEYGFMLGTVERVSDFPVGSDRVALPLAGAGPVFEMRVRLTERRDTPSGFAWSTSAGPPSEISSGTLVTASVVVARRQPIALILPFLRRTAGVS
jgi:multidrug efflux pump subunit AcrA (membrane-fusion protein)